MTTIDKLYKRNSKKYNIRKCAEEASELATALLQLLNKWDDIKKRGECVKAVIAEIGDMEVRLQILKKQFGNMSVNKRIRYKLDKYEEYIKEDKYKNI